MTYIIKEIKDSEKVCCICGEKIEGYGNNPWPVKEKGECCDKCNYEEVIPARIRKLYEKSEEVTTKDDTPQEIQTIEELTTDEFEAIEAYKKAISKTKNPKFIALLKHILEEEWEHVRELQNEDISYEETIDDSIKDAPIGFDPKIEEKTIITWKNIHTPKSLKEELDRYDKSDDENEKKILKERIVNHIREVHEDCNHDAKIVEKSDLNKHYKKYNDIIDRINSTFEVKINKF